MIWSVYVHSFNELIQVIDQVSIIFFGSLNFWKIIHSFIIEIEQISQVKRRSNHIESTSHLSGCEWIDIDICDCVGVFGFYTK